jgi:hypothetical protein
MLKRFFHWVFDDELEELHKAILKHEQRIKRLDALLGAVDVSVDVNINDQYRARSWAVISLQGQQGDFIKFYALGNRELYEIQRFLKQFERDMEIKIDAAPHHSAFLRFDRK